MRRVGFAVALVLAMSSVAAAQRSTTDLIVTTDWLAQHLNDPTVVVLHVVRDSNDYGSGHIPGAREILYSEFTAGRGANANSGLPTADELKKVFERLGVSDESHVVIYTGAGLAPEASRAFLTLDYLGHENVSLLSGGLARWRAEGRAVTTERPRVTPGKITPKSKGIAVDAECS